MGSFLNFGSLLGVLFIRVPYYIGDLKGDPTLENYPLEVSKTSFHPQKTGAYDPNLRAFRIQ